MYSPTNASFDTGGSVDVCKTRLDSRMATVGSVDGARDEAHDAMRSQATTSEIANGERWVMASLIEMQVQSRAVDDDVPPGTC